MVSGYLTVDRYVGVGTICEQIDGGQHGNGGSDVPDPQSNQWRSTDVARRADKDHQEAAQEWE